MTRSQPALRVGFLYTGDLRLEFAGFADKTAPAHRLFGAGHLAELGAEPVRFSWPRWWPRSWEGPWAWRLVQTVRLLTQQRSLHAVVASTEAAAYAPLLLRRLGLLRRPLVVLTVAALKPSNTTGWRRLLIGWLLRGGDTVICYASCQVPALCDAFRLSPGSVESWPFAVDTDFFRPLDLPAEFDVVSVGANELKDFETLLAALPDSYRCLIVTDDGNRDRIADLAGPLVTVCTHIPIAELPHIYGSGRHFVVPLKSSSYSSGQTVLLENLVSGRRVITARVPYVQDYVAGVATTQYEPGDAASLREILLAAPQPVTAAELAEARQRFSSQEFSRRLLEVCTRLGSPDAPATPGP